MTVLAGIDEAGYGPTLGPLVLGISLFRLPGEPHPDALDLYGRLAGVVTRDAASSGPQLAVTDSKVLYRQARGLGRLEEAVLAFLRAGGRPLPEDLGSYLRGLAWGEAPVLSGYPWYARPALQAAPPVPRQAERARVEEVALRLATAMEDRGMTLLGLGVLVIPAGEFNRCLARTGNKAHLPLRLIRELLVELHRQHGEEGVVAHVDRQGGRKRHRPALQEDFPLFALETLQETATCSGYRIREAGRTLEVTFRTEADRHHLEVALASLAAKLTREYLMERLNAHFQDRQPGLRATAGYPGDARRWLEETSALRRELAVADELLIRQR
jgi:hypothetical protein